MGVDGGPNKKRNYIWPTVSIVNGRGSYISLPEEVINEK